MLERSVCLPMASTSPPRQRFLIRRRGQCQLFRETLAEGIDLAMVWIPPGRFWMGSPLEEPERRESEGPQHLVQLQGFFLGRTPITQAQWRVVAGWLPLEGESAWKRDLKPDPLGTEMDERFRGDDRPVVNVSWQDAMEFCRRLSLRSGKIYTLPSEAQWEYACRAGSTTPFHCGATLSPQLANYDASSSYAGGPTGEYRRRTTDVGSFPANAWGLQDMHGNLWDWCLDHWHDSYVEGDNKAPTDGSAWMKESAEANEPRELRGGSWGSALKNCRSACRSLNAPDAADEDVGFRVCCLPQDLLLDP
jgi:formylglycine-generating enzyme required for sulfatase activity